MIDSTLLDQLNSPNPDERKRAIRVLARSQHPDALTLLSAAYKTETDPEIRDLVAKAGRYIQKQRKNSARPFPPVAGDETLISLPIADEPTAEVLTVKPKLPYFGEDEDTAEAKPVQTNNDDDTVDFSATPPEDLPAIHDFIAEIPAPVKDDTPAFYDPAPYVPSKDDTPAFSDTTPRRTIEMVVEIPQDVPVTPNRSVIRRVFAALEMVLVLGISLILLSYVGFGEASRAYPTLEMDNLAAQGEIVNNAMQSFLLAGLPLSQFPGFNTITQPLLEARESIYALYITDPNDQVIFANARGTLDAAATADFHTSAFQTADKTYIITENDGFYRTSLELRSRFETVGLLHVLLPKNVITNAINSNFVNVPVAGVALLLIFAVYVFIKLRRDSGGRWLSFSYGLIFLTMAGVVIFSLVNLYTSSIQGKTVALANSFSQRLNAPLELGIDLNEFGDLDTVFKQYQTLNPDLSYVAMTVDGQVAIHTDPTMISSTWQTPANHFAVSLPLQRPNETALTELHLGVPTSLIYSALWRSVKNFVVLFIAASFLSLLFFRLMRSFSSRNEIEQSEEGQRDFRLGLISPFYFLTVFAEALAASFLPQYLKNMARAGGVDESLVSTLFTVYFLSFVIALIPSGQYAERKGPKPLLLLGMLLVGGSMLLMAFVNNIYAMFLIRALAGFGQGMLLVAVQSFILQTASDKQKTRAAAIIVFGYNGGTISGAAIGALLVMSMQTQGVFIMGALIALFSLWYAITLIPRVTMTNDDAPTILTQSFISRARNALRDFEFVKAMLFIGIPAKAVLTGVTVFAMPLLLSQQNYAQEDIGQIIMLYAAGVLISSSYISRLVDHVGKTTGILFIGMVGSGVGLILIGLSAWKPVMESGVNGLSPAFLIVGMVVLGLAHGFIHAPIVTHISTTAAAESLGKTSATSLYRLLERIGHVSGPIIVSNLLLVAGNSLFTLSWLGLVTIAFGFLFLIRIADDPTSHPAQVAT